MTDGQRKLAEDNINLCYWKSHRYLHKFGEDFFARMGMQFDDIVSLGYTALCKAAIEYDPEKGTFATLYVWKFYVEMRRVIRSAFTQVGKAMTNAVSYDVLLDADGTTFLELVGSKTDDISDQACREMRHEVEEAANRVLSEREVQILKCAREEEMTQQQISKRVGVSQAHVSRLTNKALKKLAEELARLGYLL